MDKVFNGEQVTTAEATRMVPVTIGEYTDLIGDSLIVDQIMSVFDDNTLSVAGDVVRAIRSILQIGAVKKYETAEKTN